ncbi:MAG: GIY-YIG nuclease family protein [Paludibacteraceae bacterium]|nr:GIY-YIG nuclease family protein [Paludibacteraceae bacterium]
MKEYRLIDLISKKQKKLLSSCREWHEEPIMHEELQSYSSRIVECVAFFHKGENFISISFRPDLHFVWEECILPAPCDGYFFFEKNMSLESYEWLSVDVQQNIIPEKLNNVFMYCAETLDELCQFVFEKYCLYNVRKNLFDDAKKIEWSILDMEDAFPISHMISIKDDFFDVFCSPIRIGIQGSEFGTNILIRVRTSFAKKSAISKGTLFTFLFKNHEKISIKSSALPVSIDKHDNQVSLPATSLLLFLLTTEDLISIKIDFVNGELSYYTDETLYSPILSRLFRLWVKKNLELIAECGYPTDHEILPTDDTRESSSTNAIKEQSCFVYLMHDKANGFYKIGISNRPEYREHTLQSEKPSIVLIVAKEFPIRAIAEAFEAALHKTYEKQRIRGEWFNLTPQDVENLKKSLI